MNNFSIKHKTAFVVRKILAVFWFINGLFWILANIGSLKTLHWFFGISFIILGITYFTNGFGSDKTYILPGIGYTKIKWLNWLRPKVINDNSIEDLTISKFKILISLKGGKTVKLNLDFYEMNERSEIYKYFIELSKEKNIQLIRDF